MEEEEFYFSCVACGAVCPAEPDAVVPLDQSIYLIDKTRSLNNTLPWEGCGKLNNTSGTLQVEYVFSDTEFSNSAIILCADCKNKYQNCN